MMIAAWGLFAVIVVVSLWPRRAHASAEASVDSGPGASFDGQSWPARKRRIVHWVGPTALALLFALVSLPLVALTFGAVDSIGDIGQRNWAPATTLGQWSAAASAVFIPALVAGTIGGFAVRRHARIGAVLTFMLALLVAIPALPLLPALLGQNVGVGVMCLDRCGPVVSAIHLEWNLWADGFFWLAPFVEPVPILILALGVGGWTRIVRQLP
jgi:hypothetical protein